MVRREPPISGRYVVLTRGTYCELGLAVLAIVEDPCRCGDAVMRARVNRLREAWDRLESEMQEDDR